MSENLVLRWLRQYKVFFLIGFIIISVQVFLAYKSLDLSTVTSSFIRTNKVLPEVKVQQTANILPNQNSVSDDEDVHAASSQQKRNAAAALASAAVQPNDSSATEQRLILEHLGFVPECDIKSKDAISALQRAKTKDCRKHIAQIACAIQDGQFYDQHLPSYCPANNHTANKPLGCYSDKKDFRLLNGYFINFKTANNIKRCIQLCLQSGFPYAGVQYGVECFCGADKPPSAEKLADSKCNMKCSGEPREICGGYYSMNVYETGVAKFTAQIAEMNIKPGVERIKIAFLLTLNGRALRQVHRLIKALYLPNHVFYIHVDARQDYLYRKLLELEMKFSNIRLARHRFSTIWGGASLLSMLLQSMADLLHSPFEWDFVINLSESDYPVKRIDKLVDFLTANKGRNFVKGHGRETLRFIQKQGLDKTFVECDTHMWRIGDRQLPIGLQVDGGSDWVALSRTFIEYVITQQHQDELLKGLMKIFKHTLLPAESFFHTVLRNSHFCNTYIDNNLHVTNWKRKLGCKCQYKHVVDWCGCSPNDFKPEDWKRLQNTENKMLFFARKFEAIINQAVLTQLDEWLYGGFVKNYPNIHAYWQSFYHTEDLPNSGDDLTRTISESLMRLLTKQMKIKPKKHLELTHYMHLDQYKGFLLRYEAQSMTKNQTLQLETRIRPVQYAKVAKNSKFAKRLRNFEVSNDFDQKEQISRNLNKFLGPLTELILSFTLMGAGGAVAQTDVAHSYNFTLLWIDPIGRLQDFNELHIEDSQIDTVNYSKAALKQPLTPGIWTVKLIGRNGIYAQNKFLVTPLAFETGKVLKSERTKILNGGTSLTAKKNLVFPSEWQPYLYTADEVKIFEQLAVQNAQRSGEQLHNWIDDLVSKFFQIRETCAVTANAQHVATDSLAALPLCEETLWSSLAPDPKSDVYDLLKNS